MMNIPSDDSGLLLSVHSRSAWSLRTTILISFGLLFAATLIITNLARTFGIPLTSYEGSYTQERAQMLKHLNLVADLKKELFLLWLNQRKHDGSPLTGLTLLSEAERVLNQMLEIRDRLGKTEAILLVDETARILTPLNHPLPDGATAKPLETRLQWEAAQRAAAGEEGVYIGQDYRGIPVLAAYRQIKVPPDRSLGMIIAVDQQEVFVPLWDRVLYSFFISVFGMLAAGILAVFVANRITRPLQELQSTALTVAGGNLAARAEATGSRETRILAEVFNAMVHRVEHWYGELQNEVRARIADLSTVNRSLVAEIAQRKEAQAALLRSEKQYRTLLDSTPDGISLTSRNGRLIEANQSLLDLFGYTREEIAGIDVRNVYVDSADRDKFLAAVERQGSVKDYAIKLRKKDGSELDCLYTSTVQRGVDGVVNEYLNIVRDITEHKRMYQALKESEERFRAVFNSDHAVLLLVDPETGRIEDASPGACAFYGYSREELRKKRITEINTLAREQIFEKMQEAESRESKYFDFRHRLANGEIRDVEVCTGPIVVGGRTLLFSVINDVTERNRAEAALRKSEGRYRALFEQSRDAIYITSRDGKLLDANQAFLDLFGCTREDCGNMDILRIYTDPGARPRFQEEMERNGSVVNYEIRFQSRDGTKRDCLLTATVRLNTDGAILGYQGIIRDVTERKRLEQQLAQSRKMEAIGTMAGGIAHDFNNLLTITSGYADLLIQGRERDDPEYGDLQKILHASRRGAELVQNLLTFSRKAETRPRPIDLNHQVEQVTKLLSRTIPKMIEIWTEPAKDLKTINADPGQIEQILMNLALNARDAMPDGGVLTIRTTNTTLDEQYARAHVGAPPGEYVALSVSDTGYGMDRDTLDHIFEPFFTTKEAGKGTGLGLATVYGIVKQHGGSITCYSEPGKGSGFHIYFPVIETRADQDVITTGSGPAFGTETILLVDDEELVRDLGTRILSRVGYTVLTACNGREALELYRSRRDEISLIIMDLIMPEMGGIQCLEEIVKIDPQAKVVVASGLRPEEETGEFIRRHAKGFVGKPYKPKEFLLSIRGVLDT